MNLNNGIFSDLPDSEKHQGQVSDIGEPHQLPKFANYFPNFLPRQKEKMQLSILAQ